MRCTAFSTACCCEYKRSLLEQHAAHAAAEQHAACLLLCEQSCSERPTRRTMPACWHSTARALSPPADCAFIFTPSCRWRKLRNKARLGSGGTSAGGQQVTIRSPRHNYSLAGPLRTTHSELLRALSNNGRGTGDVWTLCVQPRFTSSVHAQAVLAERRAFSIPFVYSCLWIEQYYSVR